jgi:predicted transcriptional regulator
MFKQTINTIVGVSCIMSSTRSNDLLIYNLNDQKDTFKLIIILHNHGKLYSQQICEEGMNDRTLIKAREVLMELGLLQLESPEGSRRKYYSLTSKGKRFAEELIILERLLLTD